MALLNEFCQVGMLQGLGQSDFNGDDSTPKERGGRYAYVVDGFGTRIFMYCRNLKSTALAFGSLASRIADAASSNIDSGSTTTAVKAATWTAGKNVGQLLFITDNDDSAGAAPEGEVGVIGANTVTTQSVDPQYPFSVALAANDDVSIISPGWHIDASAAADKAQEVKGVVVGSGGMTSLYYGWVQCYGICPVVNLKASTGFTARAGIIADTAAIAPDASGGLELVIGYNVHTVTSDIVADKAAAFLNLYCPAFNIGTP